MISKATACIHCRCPWWFRSFCAWYDAWSALIAASMQVYSKVNIKSDSDLGILVGHTRQSETISSFLDFYHHFTNIAMNCQGPNQDPRFIVIREALLKLNPFPHCSLDGCDCFGRNLKHEYQWVSGNSLSMKRFQIN